MYELIHTVLSILEFLAILTFLGLVLALICLAFLWAFGALFFSDADNPFYNEEVAYDDDSGCTRRRISRTTGG